jgi:hypothetical protein
MGCVNNWDRSRKRPLHKPEGLKPLVARKGGFPQRSSHVYRGFAILAEIRLGAYDLRFEKLENRHRLTRRTVPQLCGPGSNSQESGIRVIRSVPPHVVGGLPDRSSDVRIAQCLGGRRDRQIGVLGSIDENRTDFVVRVDFVLFATAQISHKPY